MKFSSDLRKLMLGAMGLAVVGGGAIALTGTPQARDANEEQHSGPPAEVKATLRFSEEFDGPALDPARWQFTYADAKETSPSLAKRNLWNNGERQVYVDPDYLGLDLDPFEIANGTLIIRARPLSGEAKAKIANDLRRHPPEMHDTALAKVEYSSGLISSRGRFSQRYGYFEMRARWSSGKGLWPAFWLLPAGGGWPPEIDILEAHGDKKGTVFHSLHSNAAKSETKRVSTDTDDDQFHNYGMLWQPDQITFYVDGQQTAQMPTRADMHKPMFMVANLAIGGHWPGYPDANVKFPVSMEIDHIRVWSVDP